MNILKACHLQTCFHWPLIKMRSLVEFTFYLSIRKIRQTDFPKPCPEHLVTITANRSSWTLSALVKPGSLLLEQMLGFLISKEPNRPQNLISKNYMCHISLKSFLANKRDQIFLLQLCTGFAWPGFGEGGAGYRSGFCERLLEALPVSDRANASWLQDRPITGQGWVHQGPWNNLSKKGDKAVALWEKQLWRQGQWRKRGRGCSTCQSWEFPAASPWRWSSCAPAALLRLCAGRSPHWSRFACRIRDPMGGTHAGAGEKCEGSSPLKQDGMNWTQLPFPVPLYCCRGGGRDNWE